MAAAVPGSWVTVARVCDKLLPPGVVQGATLRGGRGGPVGYSSARFVEGCGVRELPTMRCHSSMRPVARLALTHAPEPIARQATADEHLHGALHLPTRGVMSAEGRREGPRSLKHV